MKIKSTEFIISNTDYRKCPESNKPEYAFIGRSNVGKSSLINMITKRTKLAKISSTPGKTQLINHFLINEEWFLVDLPGYGWAKVSKNLKEKWNKMIKGYLVYRKNLYNIFVLIDSRIPPQKIDLEFINWLGGNNIALSIIFTKTDKPNNLKIKSNIQDFKIELRKSWEKIPNCIVSSSAKKTGGEEILSFINQINNLGLA